VILTQSANIATTDKRGLRIKEVAADERGRTQIKKRFD